MIRWIISRLSMKKGEPLFVDCVNGRTVYSWTDKFGQEYMAQDFFGTRCKT